MAFYYHAFGLTFQTSEPIPWLPEQPGTAGADIRIEFSSPSPNSNPEPDEFIRAKLLGPAPSSEPRLLLYERTSDGRFRFQYRDGTEFTVSADGCRIRGAWPKTSTVEDAATYLLGPVVGFVLRLQGNVCLHASAVSDSTGAIAFMAPAGFGKSSTAAMLARWGYAVCTDDILALAEHENIFQVLPGWPHLRLWPDSVTAIFGRADALPRLCPASVDWDKCYLNLTDPGFRFQSEPMPLKAIYAPRFDPASSDLRVEPMHPMAALQQLLTNTYSWYSLNGAMRAAELDCLTRLVQQVPVRTLTIRDSNRQGLERQCRAILDDAAAEGIENLFAANPKP